MANVLKKTFIGIVICFAVVMFFGWIGKIEQRYTVNAEVDYTEDDGMVVAIAEDGNIWAFYSDTDLMWGTQVRLTLDRNNTDSIKDDRIVDYKIIESREIY